MSSLRPVRSSVRRRVECESRRDPTPPADQKLASASGWLDVCNWIREHTSQEALFLAPRRAQSLSWNAERKSLVNWKDVPQDAASLITWRDRYFDVYWHFDEYGDYVLYRSLAWQGAARIRALAEKYGVDYVITREYPPLQLPIAYGNAWYTIYAVSPAAEEPCREHASEVEQVLSPCHTLLRIRAHPRGFVAVQYHTAAKTLRRGMKE